VLYTDIHLHSLNPTNTLTSALWAAAAETVMFGPGLVSAATLQGGIRRFADRHGPFDALVFGPNIPVLSDAGGWAAAVGYVQRYAALAPPPETCHTFLEDLFRGLPHLPVRWRIACLATLDYYGTSPRQIERIESLGLHIMGAGREFAPRLAELPDWARSERHFQRKADRLSDAWADFVSAKPSRVLTSLHFIAESEFSFRSLDGRRGVVSVPGAEYALRAQGRAVLRQAAVRQQSKRMFNLYRIANRLGLPVYSRYLPLKIFNMSYVGGLIDTRYVYTARGGFGIPVRKFFEIPAAGAVLICSPPLGFPALGFGDGVHYVAAEPDALPDAIAGLEREPERAQAIADAGRRLVWAEHSLAARARQLADCLAALAAGCYLGSTWQRGRLVVEQAGVAA
jgi:glycosyltransferase involved in cell wall biosynthesis